MSEPVQAGPSPDVTWGLDTNVLARYLVGDDAAQQEAARELIEGACTPEHPGLVHPVMICELVWVPRSVYRASAEEIAEALDLLLRIRSLRVLDESTVQAALTLYRSHVGVDFADAYLHVAYQVAGAAGLATFDLRAARLPGARARRGEQLRLKALPKRLLDSLSNRHSTIQYVQ